MKQKTLIKIIIMLALLYTAIMLFSCSEESDPKALRQSAVITYEVTAVSDACVPVTFKIFALVDKDDKFETASAFDCDHGSGTATLDAGDLFEIRIINGQLNKGIKYNVKITQGDHVEEFNNVAYTGIKYTVR